MKRKKGFTLIEVLIVICIIGILAAITIPNIIEIIKHKNKNDTQIEITIEKQKQKNKHFLGDY